ncbi:MAG: glycosyltransferase [Chloroflexi bacterium]|nr:glycosyltransferase [Chloroflexota bacterium]
MLAGLSPDITHLHFPYPIGEISQLLLNRGRTVITYHSDVVRGSQQLILRLYRPLMRLVLRRAARIVVTSPNYIVSSPHLRRMADRCVVVPLGVDLRRFQPESVVRPTGLLRNHQSSVISRQPSTFNNQQIAIGNLQSKISNQQSILFLGRLRYYKGLDTLIHAMQEINARLILGGDGPMRAEWEALAQRIGVADRVTFVGELPEAELAAFYHSGDLFVLPASARSEAFGTVLLEAMASGLACVTTELGTGTSYVVQDGVTGLVVPPHSSRALADAINRLLADDELRTRMSQAGLARAKREFALEKMVEKVEAVYRWARANLVNEYETNKRMQVAAAETR